MRTTIFAGLVLLALAGGCGTPLDRPDAVARRTTTAPSAPASSGPPFDREALSERAKKTLMAPGAMVNVGVAVKPEDEMDVKVRTSDYCNLHVINEGVSTHVAHLRSWRARSITVVAVGHGYDATTGKDAVDATRRNAQNCTTYEVRYSDGTGRFELLDVVDLGTVAGVDDAYARCDKRTFDPAPPVIACSAFLGRGKLLSSVTVYYGGTVASASAKLREIVPIAAAALAAT
jgi:hypothetical protein